MARLQVQVKLQDIDLSLRRAQIFLAQVHFLNYQLNIIDVDDTRRSEIVFQCQTIFGDMMCCLYSVLDKIYFYLYCRFQNNGYVLISKDTSQINQPITTKLKWSNDDTRDAQSECEGNRNKWITNQCKKLLGVNCPQPQSYVRYFQDNLLQLQAIRKVNESGREVPGPNGGPTLSRAYNIKHDPAGNVFEFNPSEVSFEDLRSVQNMDDWGETIVFNLIHFLRNCTVHKFDIEITFTPRAGYLNLETGEFTPRHDQKLSNPWRFISEAICIPVPELSHLRQEGNVMPTFYDLPLDEVCDRFFTFVRHQRRYLCHSVGGEYPYDVGLNLRRGKIVFRKNNQYLGECEWKEARFFSAT